MVETVLRLWRWQHLDANIYGAIFRIRKRNVFFQVSSFISSSVLRAQIMQTYTTTQHTQNSIMRMHIISACIHCDCTPGTPAYSTAKCGKIFSALYALVNTIICTRNALRFFRVMSKTSRHGENIFHHFAADLYKHIYLRHECQAFLNRNEEGHIITYIWKIDDGTILTILICKMKKRSFSHDIHTSLTVQNVKRLHPAHTIFFSL